MTESSRFYKALKLITPEQAQTIGIEAAEPMFVSPYCPTHGCYDHCGRPFAPQAYAVGEETEATHRCQQAGGIYLYYGRDPELVVDVTHDTGFAGVVEPIGEVLDYSEKAAVGIGRVRAVRVTEIYAVCSVTNPPHKREPLEGGGLVPKEVLLPYRADMQGSPTAGVLVPICCSRLHRGVGATTDYFQAEAGRLTVHSIGW